MGDDAYVAAWSGGSARGAAVARQRTRGAGAGCGGGVANRLVTTYYAITHKYFL